MIALTVIVSGSFFFFGPLAIRQSYCFLNKTFSSVSVTVVGNHILNISRKSQHLVMRKLNKIQKFGFINGVDNVNWPPYRDSKS